MDNILAPLAGGAIIGIGSSVLFLGIGRISGISSIFSHLLNDFDPKESWKYLFIVGLLIGGLFFKIFFPSMFNIELLNSKFEIIIAGLLVGFGTRLGNGCTSGHGVCGISRFSIRSIIATLVFMAAGIVTVFLKGAI
ncbi:YeeE/YedE family protein [Halobacteriovorax marinus]|uniref:YeeE/YedE family protein n=1 Tax=Halobacteriovorax marinus TaxID=97084 RepID=UPI000BC2CE12|nr:YeeE/YedE family protein [Halobacteriovorax marinus]ATH07164.1 YeeE/YedE family protein [Halobacteriovorax marinus]